MRLLLIHARKFSYTPLEKEIDTADLAAKGKKIDLGKCLVAFTALEEGDNEDKIASMASQIIKDAEEVKENRVVVYPFVHLTERPLGPDSAIKMLPALARALSQGGLEAHRAPFGWNKSFSIETMPHPLAERGLRARNRDHSENGPLAPRDTRGIPL